MSDPYRAAAVPPLARWERELGVGAGERLVSRGMAALRDGRWRAGDLEWAIERAERRLTRLQRDAFWRVITRDAELAELSAKVGG